LKRSDPLRVISNPELNHQKLRIRAALNAKSE
jgi:hypothetical protein